MALTFPQVRDAALGRWKDLIFPAFAITVPTTKNKHGPCPICGGTKPFRCDDKQGKGTWICNHCNAGDGFELIVKARGLSHSEVLKEVGGILGLSSETKVTDADRQKWRENQGKRWLWELALDNGNLEECECRFTSESLPAESNRGFEFLRISFKVLVIPIKRDREFDKWLLDHWENGTLDEVDDYAKIPNVWMPEATGI